MRKKKKRKMKMMLCSNRLKLAVEDRTLPRYIFKESCILYRRLGLQRLIKCGTLEVQLGGWIRQKLVGLLLSSLVLGGKGGL